MNFFINQAMGMGNSGVEHAQFYRADRFDQAGLPYRYIFLSFVPELHKAADNWHLKDNQIINLWEYLVLGGDYLTKGLAKRQKPDEGELVIDKTNTHRKREATTDSGIRYVEHFVKGPDKHKPDNNILQVSRYRTEMYNAKTGERKVMFEVIDDPHRKSVISNIHLFNQDGQHMFFRNLEGLHRYFFEQLDAAFGGQSNFIIDRGEFADDVLMQHRIPNSKIIYIVHADQLANRDDKKYPLWNDHYEYMMEHMDAVDKVITATKRQREDMLVDFPNDADKIVAIPVGGVSDDSKKIQTTKMHKPMRLITASRLAAEKHVDIAVKAVAKLHDAGHDVIFDIYGQGEKKKEIEDTIKEVGAEDYISMKGLSNDLENIYPKYDAFISTSWSEGFGLTYIEALNAALPVVTFDARFGAQELVQDGVNGFLQDLKRDDEDYDVDQIYEGLERLLAADYKELKEGTQKSVEPFQNHVTAEKWKELIDGLRTSK
ncbi:accessory Sec system glycosylation protein GtfA [Weissella uvarum]|uniref:glycosyltransferase n=1 Tax=Weissella uvarum TaxID=1479233 RepID=UPI0019621A52|nr:glycosyltransferase [Weissella uvarum]MBM7616673.1 accessory Sec system glycosylation protein GtfA [Weissella uvarum]MCM0594873.1 glycosyltransferase [Weissella uvarum]